MTGPAQGFLSDKFTRRLFNVLKRMVHVIRMTVVELGEDEAAMRAAALAYQGLLSIFPLLLFLIFLGSQFLTSTEVRTLLNDSVAIAVPGMSENIQQVIDQTLRNRGSIGLIGSLGLLWTASALFNRVEASLNAVWNAPRRVLWRRRLWAISLVLSLGTLFLLSLIVSAFPAFPGLEDIDPAFARFDTIFNFLITILLFFLLYYWLPNCKVRRQTALIAAILSGAMWEGAKTGFRIYLVSGLANYGAVYGSLASVIALILWAYLTGMILLIGAEFGAKLQEEFWPVPAEPED